ncbi:putative permease [Sedimentisphaera cyanobacteriorum]|uniref:Putative permease n=1 Tax=Sedimentisphaera cyanobacteriorum TaxID=1940790 RepID=A0A1Q2HSR7_9BACT|nr:permease [Sedimentisphaera cyanobacteriorum]AQQ10492.1 putative permease [Sedimentisphaera cyanobacteriorum]
MDFFTIFFDSLMQAAPYVILGMLIAGAVRNYVPQDVLRENLGGNSPLTLLKSVGIGCILPLCSCGTIPLGIGLYRSGAAVGNMLAFMTSAPVLSPVLIVLAIKLLGFKITLTLIFSAVVGAMVIGWIGNRLFPPKVGFSSACCCENMEFKYHSRLAEKGRTGKLLETVRWSFLDLGADICIDILIGLGIVSVILAILPMEWISRWLGQQDLFTLVYVVILGIFTYACSIPSIPIIQGLLLMGASPGAAMAYMIAGPATNFGELYAIGKSMGKKPAVYYAGALIVLAITAGYLTDRLVFPDYQYRAFRQQGELVIKQCCVPVIFGEGVDVGDPQVPGWHWPFGFLLFGVIGFGFFKKVKHFLVNPCQCCVWKSYEQGDSCGAKCHVRRKHDFFQKYIARPLKNLYDIE